MFTGNKLICDCRLAWVSKLRNETKSEPLKYALEDITCKPRTENNIEDTLIKEVKEIINEGDDDQNDETAEVFQQDDSSNDSYDENQNPTAQSMIANQLVLVDIPAETLPCPRELTQNGEGSMMLSSKDKSFWNSNSSSRLISSLLLILSFNVMLW